MAKKTKKEDLFETFVRKKPALLILSLYNGNISKSAKYGSVIAKNIDCTYSHTIKLLKEMEGFGLVSFEKVGRIKTINLTTEGKNAAEKIESLRGILKK